MSPVSPIDDRPNSSEGEAEHFGDFFDGSPVGVKAANVYHCGLIYDRHTMPTPFWLHSFFYGVKRVFFWCSEKQVVRINAGWIVSPGAVVTNFQNWVFNWAVRYYPGVTMGTDSLPVNREFSVAAPINSRGPKPTRFCFVDMTPESQNMVPGAMVSQVASAIAKFCRVFTARLSLTKFFSAIRTYKLHLKTFLLDVDGASDLRRWPSFVLPGGAAKW